MQLQGIIKHREDGSIGYVQTAQIFSVEAVGNGIARGQISVSKKPYGARDDKLVAAGYKLDEWGYIRGSKYVTFGGNAAQKAIESNNGAVITNIKLELDVYPYVNKDGMISYSDSVMITDFDFKTAQPTVEVAQQPTMPAAPIAPVAQANVQPEQANPYGY